MTRAIRPAAGAALALALIGAAPAVQASPMLWTLSGATFTDGGTEYGSFDYDASTGTYSNVDIVTTPGSVLSGQTYTVLASNSGGIDADELLVLATGTSPTNAAGDPGDYLEFATPLTASGGTIAFIGDEATCLTSVCTYGEPTGPNRFSTGDVTAAIPEPGGGAILAGALLGLMALRLRRPRIL